MQGLLNRNTGSGDESGGFFSRLITGLGNPNATDTQGRLNVGQFLQGFTGEGAERIQQQQATQDQLSRLAGAQAQDRLNLFDLVNQGQADSPAASQNTILGNQATASSNTLADRGTFIDQFGAPPNVVSTQLGALQGIDPLSMAVSGDTESLQALTQQLLRMGGVGTAPGAPGAPGVPGVPGTVPGAPGAGAGEQPSVESELESFQDQERRNELAKSIASDMFFNVAGQKLKEGAFGILSSLSGRSTGAPGNVPQPQLTPALLRQVLNPSQAPTSSSTTSGPKLSDFLNQFLGSMIR